MTNIPIQKLDTNKSWIDKRIKRDQITKYLDNGRCFIHTDKMFQLLK